MAMNAPRVPEDRWIGQKDLESQVTAIDDAAGPLVADLHAGMVLRVALGIGLAGCKLGARVADLIP